MPDWFYRTVSRPLLFRLPATTARGIALGFMGRLVRLPGGPALIDFLGHLGADPRLRQSTLGIDLPGPVGLGPRLDGKAQALPALARFGFGFLDIGPVVVRAAEGERLLRCHNDVEAIEECPFRALELDECRPRLAEARRLGLPIFLRVGCSSVGASPETVSEQCAAVIRATSVEAACYCLATLQAALRESWQIEAWEQHVRTLVAAAAERPILIALAAGVEVSRALPFVDVALRAGARGVLIDGIVPTEQGTWLSGAPARQRTLEWTQTLRGRLGPEPCLIASGGVHEPADALALRAAGADLIEVDTGLVFTGPGLTKRINDAILFEKTRREPPPPAERAAEMTWFWTTLMGAGMLLGSLLALVFAATRVILPYDEMAVGLTRAELAAFNPRLLPFMAHDRVSLAGTMVAIGVMYVGLSLFGIRQGLHWARQAVFVSAFTGFASFFLFLGFGYLDPFHAFVTAVLLQFLLLGVHSRLGTHVPDTAPPPRGGRAWLRAQWGQLLLIVHGFGLLGAGLTISAIGATTVFVHEDLEYLRTTAEVLSATHPRLVPLVAHDRATFGGMLLASGWAFLLPALWGFRAGSPWLWWTLLCAGLAAYAAAIGVHFVVGYTDWFHLLPACAGMALLVVGLGLSREFLCA